MVYFVVMGAHGEKYKSSFRAVDFRDVGEQVGQLQGDQVEEVSEKQEFCWEGWWGLCWGALGWRTQRLSAIPEFLSIVLSMPAVDSVSL